jgi:hypothetical protein
VDRTVMPTAEGDEIREICLSSPHPVDHVVNFREVHELTTRETTTFVSARDLNPLGDRGAAAHAFLIEDGAIAVLDREHNLGIAGQASRHLW